mgnify:CR=1 FL=1
MTYPRKPRCFKSDYQIEVERRQAITAAYQTLYKEAYEENKKLKKDLAQIQREFYMKGLAILNLEIDIEHRDETIADLRIGIMSRDDTIKNLNNDLKG